MMDSLATQFQDLKLNFIPSADPAHDQQLLTSTSRVYLRYDIANLPPHPGNGWTRFVCVSDTHGWTPDVPMGDVLIHAGDLSVYGRRKSFDTTIKYLKRLPHPMKLIIAGNHDRLLDTERYPDEMRDLKLLEYARNSLVGPEAYQAGVRYLQFQGVKTRKPRWKVYGSPATPWYSAGAFQYKENDAAAVNSIIPRDTQILITHGPPRGVLDRSRRGKSCGCPALAARLFAPESSSKRKTGRVAQSPLLAPYSRAPQETSNDNREEYNDGAWLPNVRLHVFGHIHEAWGAAIITREPPSTTQSMLEPGTQASSSPSTTAARFPEPGSASMPVETVFVNAAVQQRGSAPIIVDLLELN